MGPTVVYRGNFRPQFSTESHVAGSLEDLGCRVRRVQEDTCSWEETVAASGGADLFLWTQTYGYACNWDKAAAFRALADIGGRMPTVGFHLDLWWGLEREWQVHADEPFFRGLDVLFTADGDNDRDWQSEGIRHVWSPPAVFGREVGPGRYRHDLASDVTFVGSWRSYAHDTWWPQRKEMLDHVRRRYNGRARFWPAPGGGAIRGQDLNDLYASCTVVVGDSCNADRSRRYFSDRAFETVGRGGFLVTPWVEGLAELVVDGEHCRYYQPGDLHQMGALIDHYLAHPDEADAIRDAGWRHVAAHHTYAHRLRVVLGHVGLPLEAAA